MTRVLTSPIRFTKMHGIGNDYVHVDGFTQTVDDPAALARAMSSPHFGVGADGLIMVLPPTEGVEAELRMRIFNRDGSEAEMCGNGIRCVCKFAFERGLATSRPMRIETGAGVRSVHYEPEPDGTVRAATVDMGAPVFDLTAIPVDARHVAEHGADDDAVEPAHVIEVAGRALEATFVSMGNPHAIVFVADVKAVALDTIGPAFERHPAFPRRVNVHFVEVHARGEVTMRTWERGSGPTLACGTGAAAVCAAGAATGRTDRDLLIHLPGGDLRLEWDRETGHVMKTGPAVEVFSGEWVVSGGIPR